VHQPAGEVIALRDPLALVRTTGIERWCNALAYPELELGDRVLVHATPASSCSS
jgi:hypothetical protein